MCFSSVSRLDQQFFVLLLPVKSPLVAAEGRGEFVAAEGRGEFGGSTAPEWHLPLKSWESSRQLVSEAA